MMVYLNRFEERYLSGKQLVGQVSPLMVIHVSRAEPLERSVGKGGGWERIDDRISVTSLVKAFDWSDNRRAPSVTYST